MEQANREDLDSYNKPKEKLEFNLKDDIEKKIERMKILYEIKHKELYKHYGFSKFEQFIKSHSIAKSQAYMHLKIYEGILNNAISIENVKEMGFKNAYKYIKKQESLKQKDLFNEDVKKDDNKKNYKTDNTDVPIRILVKNKEVYRFCKEDTKRLYFIIEELYLNNKDFLFNIISKYHEQKKKRKQK